jgi:hypothetical protein
LCFIVVAMHIYVSLPSLLYHVWAVQREDGVSWCAVALRQVWLLHHERARQHTTGIERSWHNIQGLAILFMDRQGGNLLSGVKSHIFIVFTIVNGS